MRLTADWLADPATQAVMAALAPALAVGGAVRDTLMGRAVGDVDLATPHPPDIVMARGQAAGLRIVPTGLAHGTITVVAATRSFEVTTFRRDVATDGRHAVVAFGADLAADAARRDFTVNALYAEADGTVLDPLGGLPDLAARRVRFIGDPAARIAEDGLRILRFFRFHAWIADPLGGIDADGLAACAAAAERIDRLSRERVGAEMRRLLAAPDPGPALGAMAAAGILARVLPGATATRIGPLVAVETAAGIAPHWPRRLAVLGGEGHEAALRLSSAETGALRAIAAADGTPAARAAVAGGDAARDALLIAAADGVPLPPDWTAEIARGAAATLPLTAQDLMPPLSPGPALGAALARARAAWLEGDLRLDRAALRRIALGG